MKIVGLDLSLTATGIATPEGPEVLRYRMPVPANDYDRAHRLKHLGVMIDRRTRDADVVIIESPFNSKYSSWQLGELFGVVKVVLLKRGVPFQMIAPATLKKFGTGRGNADKNMMLAAAIRDLDYQGSDHNEADALFLRLLGSAWYLNVARGESFAPKYRLDVVRSIKWVEPRRREETVDRAV